MNCDECKERVFELIEREAVDPEGVREILARCPDCRITFDEMKAALAVVKHLPIEAPAAAVDAAILRAAAARAPKVVPLRRRRLQPPPWAMAAIALLAVGVGVWSIPRAVRLESEVAPTTMKNADERIAAEPMLDQEAAIEEGVAQAKPAAARTPAAPPKPARAKRRSSPSTDEAKTERMAAAPASQLAADPAAGAAAESWSAEADSSASSAREQERGDDDAASCKRKVAEIERRKRAVKDYVPEPEEELEVGKCYLTLDQDAEARKWLQRAAAHRETKARAEKALRELPPE